MEKLKRDYKTLLLSTQASRKKGIVRQDIDAYLAGFFDGEGHVSIRSDPRRAWSYYVEVGATQIDQTPLKMLVKAYGGTILKKSVGTNQRQCYAWKCGGKDAFWALWRMLPWLTVKRVKARAAVIVLQHRPLACAGGQISQYQKTVITRAVKDLHIIQMKEKRWSGKNQKAAKAVPAGGTEQTSHSLPEKVR